MLFLADLVEQDTQYRDLSELCHLIGQECRVGFYNNISGVVSGGDSSVTSARHSLRARVPPCACIRAVFSLSMRAARHIPAVKASLKRYRPRIRQQHRR